MGKRSPSSDSCCPNYHAKTIGCGTSHGTGGGSLYASYASLASVNSLTKPPAPVSTKATTPMDDVGATPDPVPQEAAVPAGSANAGQLKRWIATDTQIKPRCSSSNSRMERMPEQRKQRRKSRPKSTQSLQKAWQKELQRLLSKQAHQISSEVEKAA